MAPPPDYISHDSTARTSSQDDACAFVIVVGSGTLDKKVGGRRFSPQKGFEV